MSVGEYLAVFASIILGLAVGDLAISLHRLLRARQRVGWDWLSLAIAAYVMLNLIAFWWATFGWYSNASLITIYGFLPDVALLFLMMLSAAAALPDEVPEQGLDLREFYFSQARYFWVLQFAVVTLIILFIGSRYVAGGWEAVAVDQRENLLALPILLVLAFNRQRWVHYILVAGVLAYSIWGYVGVAMEDVRAATHLSNRN